MPSHRSWSEIRTESIDTPEREAAVQRELRYLRRRAFWRGFWSVVRLWPQAIFVGLLFGSALCLLILAVASV
jgi:hypothetical protein